MKKKETLYALIEKISYGNKSLESFEAGFVKHSRHKQNTVYIQFPTDFMLELTDDEALAIINILSHTLWQRNVPISREKKKKLKWITKKIIEL